MIFGLNVTNILICIPVVIKFLLVLILTFLVLFFSKRMYFYQARIHDVEQAKKGNALYKRICFLNVPIDLQLYLTDHAILPIALYGVVRSRTLKIATVLKIYIILFSDISKPETRYTDIYVTGRIRMTSNTNSYQIKNDKILLISY